MPLFSLPYKQLLDGILFVFRQAVHRLKGILDLLLEVPAGHLPQGEPPGQLISRHILRTLAYLAGNIKRLADGKFDVVKNGTYTGRFLGFAFGAPPGMRGFSTAKIGIPAFPANKAFLPLDIRKKFETLFIVLEHLSQ